MFLLFVDKRLPEESYTGLDNLIPLKYIVPELKTSLFTEEFVIFFYITDKLILF